MKVIYNGKEVATIPDHAMIGETVIADDTVYEIRTKTYDCDNDEVYCKVTQYYETVSVCDMLNRIYGSHTFKTSGIHTNEIENNPRFLVLIILMSILIDEEHLIKNINIYKKNIMRHWSSSHIEWGDIFSDNPDSIKTDMALIKELSLALFKAGRIAENVWPKILI